MGRMDHFNMGASQIKAPTSNTLANDTTGYSNVSKMAGQSSTPLSSAGGGSGFSLNLRPGLSVGSKIYVGNGSGMFGGGGGLFGRTQIK